MNFDYIDSPIKENTLKRFLLSTMLVFIAAVFTVNAPSLFQGYGGIVAALTITALLLSPAYAAAATFIGFLAAVPIVLYAKTMFLIVLMASILLRPLAPLLGSYTKKKAGEYATGLVVAALDSVLSTIIAVLYYGDDGIHIALSVFDVITALLAVTVYKLYLEDRLLGLVSALGLLLFIAGSKFYFSYASLAGLIAILLTYYGHGKMEASRAAAAASILVIILGLIAGYAGLLLNLKILSYPVDPSSYTDQRWSISGDKCGTLENVFENTYDPMRLRIVGDCMVAEGIIESVPHLYNDGDICFDMKVTDSNYETWASLGTIILRGGLLHVEIVEADHTKILGEYNMTLCQGDIVRVWGPLVVDTDHGQWSEIHPVLGLEITKRGKGPCITFNNTSP